MKITQQQMSAIKRAGYLDDNTIWFNSQRLPVIVSQMTEFGYGAFYAVKVQPSGKLTRIKGIAGSRDGQAVHEEFLKSDVDGWTMVPFDFLEVQS